MNRLTCDWIATVAVAVTLVESDFDESIVTRIRLGLGAQGPIYGYFGTVPALEIGGHRFEDVLTTYSNVADGGSKVDEVMVGLGIFTRFLVAFDYPRQRLFLRPSRSFDDPFVVPEGGNEPETAKP